MKSKITYTRAGETRSTIVSGRVAPTPSAVRFAVIESEIGAIRSERDDQLSLDAVLEQMGIVIVEVSPV